jgi:hypothetical protein
MAEALGFFECWPHGRLKSWPHPFEAQGKRALEEQKQIPGPSYPSRRTFFLAWRFAPAARAGDPVRAS